MNKAFYLKLFKKISIQSIAMSSIVLLGSRFYVIFCPNYMVEIREIDTSGRSYTI